MCFYTGDSSRPSVYRETSVKKSKKDRKCSDCFKVIPAGSAYTRVFGVWDGMAQTFTQCPDCVALRSAIESVELDAGCDRSESQPLLGDLRDQLREEANHYHESLVRLGFLAEAEHLLVVVGEGVLSNV